MLEENRIKTAKWSWVEKEDDAIRFFKKIKKPVVLKVISKDIIHKMDKGAVILNLDSEEKIRKAYRDLKERFPRGRILTQEMIKGIELFLGGKKDKIFGWVVIFGIGGIFVEVYEDISMRLAPIDEKEAEEMVNEIKGSKILKGYRGIKINKKELLKTISRFSYLITKTSFREIEINPLICNERGCFAVDFRVVE